MAPDPTTSEPFASFDPPLAAAVAAVLRAHGIAASEHDEADGEVAVRVEAGRREESFAVVADQMDAIRDLAAAQPAGSDEASRAPARRPEPRASSTAAAVDDDEDEPVIVLDVLRRYGVVIVLVLAPLLVVTLSRPSFPLAFALAVIVGGAAAIVWWREREER